MYLVVLVFSVKDGCCRCACIGYTWLELVDCVRYGENKVHDIHDA